MAKTITVELTKDECKIIALCCGVFPNYAKKYKSKAALKQKELAKKVNEDFENFVKHW